jgi:hypothetical protein
VEEAAPADGEQPVSLYRSVVDGAKSAVVTGLEAASPAKVWKLAIK